MNESVVFDALKIPEKSGNEENKVWLQVTSVFILKVCIWKSKGLVLLGGPFRFSLFFGVAIRFGETFWLFDDN